MTHNEFKGLDNIYFGFTYSTMVWSTNHNRIPLQFLFDALQLKNHETHSPLRFQDISYDHDAHLQQFHKQSNHPQSYALTIPAASN